MDVGQVPEDLGKVDGRAPLGDLDMPPAFQRREQHEQIGRPVALVLVVVARWLPGLAPAIGARVSAISCLQVSSRQTSGRCRVVRPRVDLQHVLHRGDERGVGLRRDHPLLLAGAA